MNILKITTSVFVLLILAIGIWFGLTQATHTKDIAEDEIRSVVFKDENQMRLKAVFDPKANVATISFEEFRDIELTRVESEGGEMYENQDYNVVLLNQEEEATLYYKDEIIFPTSDDLLSSFIGEDSNTALYQYKWVWKETQMNDGSIITPDNQDAFTLTFTQDGNVSGTTDCNGFGGSYSLNQSKITFGPFMQTLMYCEGSQEQDFVRSVTDSTSYIFDQNNNLVLLIKYDSGSVLFEKGETL